MAATRASWARSSATPMSRVIRARTAITLADSIRQTASIALAVGVESAMVELQLRSGARLLVVDLAPDAIGALARLVGVLVAEVLALEHLADLQLALLARLTRH